MDRLTHDFMRYLKTTGKIHVTRAAMLMLYRDNIGDASLIEPAIVTYLTGLCEFEINSNVNLKEVAAQIFADLQYKSG